MVLVLSALVVAWIAHGWRLDSVRAAAFESIATGDPEEDVIAGLGTLDRVESPGRPFLRYASSACSTPCTKRLWWEHAFLAGIEAWSVELGDDSRDLQTAHWVSP